MSAESRQFWLIVLGALLLGGTTAALTYHVVSTYVIPPNMNDPLVRQKYAK